MHAMAEWYIRGDSDQTKLSRILDVAQDLKVTSFFHYVLQLHFY
jgi:CCR4-NOT transcription complex subunit 1